ncbi:SpoIIE family protein phosphatase [Streptomyces sp. NPDC001848]|uniref:SpoIIE family protein phosphatase n=1 Tax=Streptomyces sp. NPDC001848 TaxID=3364618 RepID=UPI0036B95926
MVVDTGIDLASVRERFLQGGTVEGSVRSMILNSWQRSVRLGLSPDQAQLPYRPDVDTDVALVRAADPVLDWLQNRFAGSRMNIGLADGEGTVLARRFGQPSLARSLPPFQVVPGFVFAEHVAGTNGIGLALAERRLCRLYGAEHFAERSQGNACSAVPIRDLLSGRIEGVLSFGCPRVDASPVMDTLITKAAHAIERRLLEQSSARERALLEAYLDARRGATVGAQVLDAAAIDLDEPAPVGLSVRDRVSVKEKAAELISAAQRGAVELTLSDGRRLILLSHVVTGPGGAEGVAVEAVLREDGPQPRLTLPGPSDEPRALAPPGAPAVPVPRQLLGVPSGQVTRARPTVRAPEQPREQPGATAPAPATADGRLVLVGEPGVGTYAVAARRRLELLSEASARIGTTLDVRRTALELAEMAVPRLADHIAIDLPEAVLRGEEAADPSTGMVRAVSHGTRDDLPFYPVGARVDPRPATPQSRCLDREQAVLVPDLRVSTGWISQEPAHTERLVALGVHSLIAVPLLARGVVLGIASFYRCATPSPFDDDDRSLAQELATRAAICIDNARRYTREHTMVLALQRSLLQSRLPEQSAVEIAHRYEPAEYEVGGDWFDVIPLSGTRVALVVGDVVGHGLHAAVTMGRLRTAARNYAELDLAPDEVLTHLDNLVGRMDRDETACSTTGIIGATCLYAVYDPTSQRATVARAGHLPPALVRPDGSVTFPDLPAGPPLGLGGLPFESAEIPLPEGSELVLYTDGLVEGRGRDLDTSFELLRRTLAHPDRAPEETCRAILSTVAPEHPDDDIALLVARTHALDPGRVTEWSLPADPARVKDVRASAIRRLADWGLDEVSFTAELLLSELVTNAVRYGSGPIRVRLIHDRTLICEVADTSSTAPHLRHAATHDEGGRGLFLVAQLAQAWGTRYTAEGKVIWAECALQAPSGGLPEAAPTDMDWGDLAGLA